MIIFQGNGLWKYFPSKTYRDYVKNEEKIYDIIMNLIKITLSDNEFMAEDKEFSSVLLMVLKAEGLDIRDKISGIIGEMLKL